MPSTPPEPTKLCPTLLRPQPKAKSGTRPNSLDDAFEQEVDEELKEMVSVEKLSVLSEVNTCMCWEYKDARKARKCRNKKA